MSNFTFLIILDVVIAIICGVIAKKKGMNPTLWFVSGLVFNFFVLAFVIALNNRRGTLIVPQRRR